MDESNNNLNPNEPNNNLNQNTNPYQGSNPYENLNPENPQGVGSYDTTNFNPYDNISSDPYSSMNPENYQNSNNNIYNNQTDSNTGIDQMNDNNIDNYQVQNPTVESNINDFDSQQIINPILNQNISAESSQNSNMNYQDNNGYNSNTNYQNNNIPDSNINYQDNNNLNTNMNYQDNSNFDTNMNYQDNSNFDTNMNYQDNSNFDTNMNYQDNNNFNSNTNYQDNNFSDPNMNYQNNNSNTNYTEPNVQYNPAQTDSNFGNYNIEFVKAWMGNLYDKAHSKKFNWPAALFGGIYFLYRKMYLTGILFILLTFLINILLTFLISKIGLLALGLMSISSLIFIFIYGFSFYPLYRNFVRNKLNKFKNTISDNSQLINEAHKKGNTSIIAVIIYCIIAPIVIIVSMSIMTSLLLSAGLESLTHGIFDSLKNNNNDVDISQVEEPTSNIELFNFSENYVVEYDSLTWFIDEENNSLTKGNYTLQFAQTLSNISTLFNTDITTPSGRSTLLTTLTSSLETQGAQFNLSVEAGLNNFVMGTNAYYGYIDVVASDSISRYYFILVPEDDIMFQFVLTTNDTTIDMETNLEAINILTTVYENPIENDQDSDLSDNNISDDNTIANDIFENNVDENNSISNDISSDNTITNDISTENVISNDVENNIENSLSNSVNQNSTLSDLLS